MTTILTPENMTDGGLLKQDATGAWSLTGAKDVVLKGITFRPTADRAALRIVGCENVTLDAVALLGNDTAAFGYGLDASESKKLSLVNSRLSGLASGVKGYRLEDFKAENNELRFIKADGIVLGSMLRYTLRYNKFSDWLAIVGGKHADAIQILETSALARTVASQFGTVVGNSVTGRLLQGIFSQGAVDLLIANNAVCTDLGTAYGVNRSVRAIFRDNIALTYHPSTTQARFDYREAVDLKWEGYNIAADYGYRKVPRYS